VILPELSSALPREKDEKIFFPGQKNVRHVLHLVGEEDELEFQLYGKKE
jgi:hypothetical protein